MENERKIKVVILINELLRGGAQRIVLDIAKNINRDQFDVHIVYLKDHNNFGPDPKTVLEEVKATGLPVTCLEGGKKFSFSEAKKLYLFLKKEKPDVVQAFMPYSAILARSIGLIAGVKSVLSVQCNLPIAYTKKVYWLDKFTLFLGKAWTGATEGIEQSYGKTINHFSKESWKQGQRHFTIVAGVDLPVFDKKISTIDKVSKKKEINIPEDARIVMMTARLISWKGHTDLIAAMQFVSQTTHLILVGWGPLEEELKQQATNQNVSNRVHFLGARNDVIELLKTADVYVQAHSYAPDGKIWMGPNTSQMEACAAYIPSVSTAVPLIEYLIEDGITGKLAKPNNPEDLAKAITFLFEYSEEAKQMAMVARKRVEEKYSVAAMVKNYEDLYVSTAA
jgi:glycosyltransferase involved in cell wall biosynthesis